MVLAADALSDTTPAAGIFRGESLPDGLDLAEPHCGDATEGWEYSNAAGEAEHIRHFHRQEIPRTLSQ